MASTGPLLARDRCVGRPAAQHASEPADSRRGRGELGDPLEGEVGVCAGRSHARLPSRSKRLERVRQRRAGPGVAHARRCEAFVGHDQQPTGAYSGSGLRPRVLHPAAVVEPLVTSATCSASGSIVSARSRSRGSRSRRASTSARSSNSTRSVSWRPSTCGRCLPSPTSGYRGGTARPPTRVGGVRPHTPILTWSLCVSEHPQQQLNRLPRPTNFRKHPISGLGGRSHALRPAGAHQPWPAGHCPRRHGSTSRSPAVPVLPAQRRQ
jgi:hypothetical protein